MGKASKWHHWRKKWVVIKTTNLEMCERMRRWNVKPNLVGKGSSFPPVSAVLWERISSLFKAKPLVIKDKTAYIPEGWLPHLDQLGDPVFLSAVGLCPYMPRGNTL